VACPSLDCIAIGMAVLQIVQLASAHTLVAFVYECLLENLYALDEWTVHYEATEYGSSVLDLCRDQ
jgi:hypothetical protein